MKIVFYVPCLPISMPRPRASMGFAGHARVHGPPMKHPVNTFKAKIAEAASAVFSGAPLTGPLGMEIVFVMPRPQSLCWRKRRQPRAWHIARPDLDNLEKALKDALTGVIWKDDCQVCEVFKRKVIAAGDEPPSVTVSIEMLKPIACSELQPATQPSMFKDLETAQ